jgi:dCTP deaminase
MILSGKAIHAAIEKGDIVVDPYVVERINPNSIDVTLGSNILIYSDEIIDQAIPSNTVEKNINVGGYTLNSGEFALGATCERVGSNKYVPILHGKSGLARAGLFVHVTADLIDIGSIGNITLQLLASVGVKLYAGMPIGQVSFWVPHGSVSLYDGKYQGSVGPQPSKLYRDPFFAMKRESL